MSMKTNTLTTYGATSTEGVYEDLSDLMTSIDPVDALIYKALGVVKAGQVKHEFMTRAHRVAASNAKKDGDAFSATAVTKPTRSYNYCQIIGETFVLSESTSASKSVENWATIEKETEWRTKDLMKDFEYALLNGVLTAGVEDTTARQMKGILNWIISNCYIAGDATLNADGTITGGTARPITKQMLKTAMQDCKSAGGNPTIAYAGLYNRGAMSDAITDGRSKQFLLKDDGKVTDAVNVYDTDFGLLKLVGHTNFPTDTILIMDERYWKRAVLRGMRRYTATPDKSGVDGTMVSLLQEFTIEARAQQSSARICNLTTSVTQG